jgi:hypothetical protein
MPTCRLPVHHAGQVSRLGLLVGAFSPKPPSRQGIQLHSVEWEHPKDESIPLTLLQLLGTIHVTPPTFPEGGTPGVDFMGEGVHNPPEIFATDFSNRLACFCKLFFMTTASGDHPNGWATVLGVPLRTE